MSADFLAFIVRVSAAALWSIVLIRTIQYPLPDHDEQARRLITTGLVNGAIVAIVLGGLYNLEITPVAWTRIAYTAVAGAVIVAALAILSLDRGDKRD